MKRRSKYIIIGLIAASAGLFYELSADLTAVSQQIPEVIVISEETPETTPLRYPVAPIIPATQEDLTTVHPIDLRTPENFEETFEYNPETNRYELRSRVGDSDVITPISLTQEEYLDYTLQKSMSSYYKTRIDEDHAAAGEITKKDDGLSMFDFNFDLGPADKIFGPGGVRLQAQGSTTIKAGFTRTSSGDPTRSERQRNRTAFDFEPQIQANIAASVGDKLNFDLNYNTQSTFGFDSQRLKLAYVGKEDEILKVLEAGNVSMSTSNSLIRGGMALFGIRTEMQFGKLTVGAIFSQQESQSRTASSKGSVQTTPFEIRVDNYDENMHFFLAHYFRDIYDDAMSALPYIKSGISISRIEVWATNKRSNPNQTRNVVAFADLGEFYHISNPAVVSPKPNSQGNNNYIPHDEANDLREQLVRIPGVRDFNQVNQALNGFLEIGRDYEKIGNARRLESSEFKFNSQLGYLSLRTPLQPDEVLAVAVEYTYGGETYSVGEFSMDNPSNTTNNLFLKLLKGTTQSPLKDENGRPISPCWNLMMKNVYTISNRSIERDRFRLDIRYQNDTTGVYLNFLTVGDSTTNVPLLRVMKLDRLDARNEPRSDGFFDYVEDFTVFSQFGKIIFPVIEPFGSHLATQIGDPTIASRIVFQELYDSTLTVARQIAEKNKFILAGEYKGGGGGGINLDGYNLAQGSATVTANGVRLRENQDYTINYATGDVTIINPAYENADIRVSYENRANFGMQRQTMMGMNLNYAFSPNFNVGATIMNLSEMPLTMKVNPGEESINNTLFGFNTNYSTQSQWLTNLIDKLPFVDATAPSQISLSAEYAQLIPGHYKNKWTGDYSYIDDFERAKITIDMRSPHAWNLSATPSYAFFPESREVNKIEYGKNRALLAWYQIDGIFTRRSSLTPTHIRNDLDQLSNHFVREIRESELFPNKDTRFTESSTIPVLNLAFYPKERGPYNLDASGMNRDGTLSNPENRWGGIFRRIESGQTDFEANNIEHIEFWLMDPFIYDEDKKSSGGDLYFNLGDISEDILKDERKFFENGLPADGDTSKVEKTVWGHVPRQQSLVYAFDNTEGARRLQDVGFNGLSTAQEFEYIAPDGSRPYADYLSQLARNLDADVVERMRQDPFSPFNDPAGDTYHHFRGSDYDRQEMPILGRYKRFNGTEGNSASSEDTNENFNTAARISPDIEDINQDNTLNENERFFQYKVELRPGMDVGDGYIVDKRVATPLLRNGKTEQVTWYQFKIPIRELREKPQGNIRDFQSIRFIRMFLTNFNDSIILRFGTLELVRGDWRAYTQDLSNPNLPSGGNAAISFSAVNIEENGDKVPVNYVMPPGVNRMTDPGQPQLIMQNEQSLAIRVANLGPGDARAVFKNTGLDTRQYKRLQMFVHAEQPEVAPELRDNELSVFLRLGSDFQNNYYEYEIPLKITPPGTYSDRNNSDREIVWPRANMFDFPFEILTNLKLNRNKERRKAGSDVTFYTPYSEFDPEKPLNKITIKGNPSVSDVKVMMIGVRNNSNSEKSTEVWVNELRLTEFNEDGGWAGNANLFLGLSDLGSLNFSGQKETTGFGSLDQGLMDRSLDDKHAINVSAQVDAGKFFPEKAKVSIPVFYSHREEVLSPKFNPLDQDILLKDALDAVETKAEKDSIKAFAQDKMTNRSLNFNNVRVNVVSKNPMPYDPANFTIGYAATENNITNATTEYERQVNQRLLLGYLYSPMVKPLQPFPKSKNKFLSDLQFGFLPKSLAVNSDINRNYFELKLYDLGNPGNSSNGIPVSFREDFYWNRALTLNWDLTKNFRLNLNTGTNARIDAPYVQVNKKFAMDEYAQWKDSVWQSIRDFGTPMEYAQRFSATYQLPFRNIIALNFIAGSVSYSARYDWQRGAIIEGDNELGNTIRNERTMGLDNIAVNFVNLYNKSKFLADANKKYTLNRQATTVSRANQRARQQQEERNQRLAEERKNKKFEGEVQLKVDEPTLLKHSLNNKRVRVTARGADGRLYEIRYKTVDANTIRINTKDSVNLNVTVSQLPPLEDLSWYKFAQGTARGLMMVRNVSFSYSQTQGMMLPGFRPEVGNFFGQGDDFGRKMPGWDFAFGFVDESYLDKAYANDWVIKSDNNVVPAMFSKTEMFNFTALVEPFVGMRINLTANRTSTDRRQIYFTPAAGLNPKLTGDFNMTTIALSSAFQKSDASNGYNSKAFDTFLENRKTIAERWNAIYMNTTYPNSGFLAGPEFGDFADQNFMPEYGMDENSVDVLIPAFLAAYTGRNASNVGLNFFPALKNLLPNWRITYEGFIQLPIISKHFKSFALEHDYKCRYAVGAYNSIQRWVEYGDGLGFIRRETTDAHMFPSPSSPFDVAAVSITEAFDPLIRLNSVFLNNMSLKIEYKTARTVNLNIASYQILETNTTDRGAGLGYRFENFNRILKIRKTGGPNFNNELRVSADISYRRTQAIVRRIQEAFIQPTSGDSQTMLKLTADYSMSQMLTLQAFFDKQISKPLVSSTAFPFSKMAAGISIKVNLSR
jgi:cell surface protein SprA